MYLFRIWSFRYIIFSISIPFAGMVAINRSYTHKVLSLHSLTSCHTIKTFIKQKHLKNHIQKNIEQSTHLGLRRIQRHNSVAWILDRMAAMREADDPDHGLVEFRLQMFFFPRKTFAFSKSVFLGVLKIGNISTPTSPLLPHYEIQTSYTIVIYSYITGHCISSHEIHCPLLYTIQIYQFPFPHFLFLPQ